MAQQTPARTHYNFETRIVHETGGLEVYVDGAWIPSYSPLINEALIRDEALWNADGFTAHPGTRGGTAEVRRLMRQATTLIILSTVIIALLIWR